MYFAGYPQFNQSMPQMSMPVNASNQQGSSVEGANTGMLGSMFGMGLGGFGFGGYGMPQMGYGGMGGYGGFGGFGGMGGYGGFGGFGMPQMGYGGFGGFGMPQMGYGGYDGFGGFGMPQMGFGLGSFGPQMGFGGYGNYGGFNPQQGPTDVRLPLPPQNTDYGRGQINTNDMVFINDPAPSDPRSYDMNGAIIPDETGQYDPNRGSSGQVLAPAPISSSPSTPVAEPLSIAGPTKQFTSPPIYMDQPRRMRNNMNMGIGSFYGGIGPGNFRNFYTP